MKLYYRELGEGQPMIILHGLFGFSDNWQTHAKKLADYFRVILVDLRNHGHSDWSDQFTYDLMADDVRELVEDLQLEDVILVGHSMGGKVAMRYAQKHESDLEKLVVVDMGVKRYPMHHQHILAGMHAVKLDNVGSRKEAEAQLSQHIDSPGVIQFLLKNLYWKTKGQLAWKMNLKVLEHRMDEILAELPSIETGIPTLFISGEMSNYVLEEDHDEITELFYDSEFVVIPGAGHWVHAESPALFLDALLSFALR